MLNVTVHNKDITVTNTLRFKRIAAFIKLKLQKILNNIEKKYINESL